MVGQETQMGFTIKKEGALLNQDKKETKRRVIGLDLFKIVCSIMITIRHFIRYSSLIGAFSGTSVNKILVLIFNTLCAASINGFILISGYFLVKSKFKIKRIFEIWGETFFFSIIFFLLGFAFRLVEFRPVYVLFAITPIISRHYWFSVAYIVLCLISPYLNKLLNAINRKEYIVLLIGGAVMFSAWTTFIYYSDGVVTGGHTGILWMIYLYAIGAFFALHPINDKKYCLLSAIASVACIVILVVYQLFKEKIAFLNNFPLLSDDSFFSLILSVSLFLLFKGIKCENKIFTKCIAQISSCSFGVYLIQENCMMRNWLWFEVVRANTMYNKWYLWVVMVGVITALFVIALLVNLIFKLIFNAIIKGIKKRNEEVKG